MASTYKPYSDVQSVLNAKIAWNNATTDEERKKQNDIATAARKRLESYGYGDIASQISADGADATATRKIYEKYAPSTTMETNNLKSNEVNRENDSLFKKYNQEYEDLKNTNPFTTAEAKAIMGKYSLAGLQGRDNAVASGGASNGGNIDSYASANAMRQQASLINQGQMTVLESHQQKIDNIRGLLSDMGVNIDRVFNQDETSKNNETARLVEEANVTGYTPSAWVIKNDDVYNTYLNEDGTFKKEMENVDIQALINSAKASGDTETANKLAVVRAKKIVGNWDGYGQYANEGDISYMKPQITEQRRQSEQDNATVRESLGVETDLAKYEIDTKKAIEDNANATELAIADKQNKKPTLTASQAITAIKNGEISQGVIDAYNYYHDTSYTVDNPPKLEDEEDDEFDNGDGGSAEEDLTKLKSNFTEKKILNFIDDVLKPYVDNGWEINEEVIEKLLVGSTDGTVVENSNSKIYNLDVEDARKICNVLGLETSWIDDKFTNRTWFNAGKGMKSKG